MFTFGKRNKDSVEITVSNRTIVRVVFLVIVSFILLAAIRQAQHALILIFTAFFLALALNSPVHWIAQRLPGKRRGDRTVATAISFFLVIGLLVGFLASIVPPLVRQTSTFINNAPALVESVRSEDSTLGTFVRKHNLEDQVNKFSDEVSGRLKNIGGTAVSTISRIGSSIFSTLTILVLTFMMLIEGPHWIKLIHSLAPDEKEPHIEKLGLDMYKVIKGFVNGQVTLAALAALLITPALFILHISYPIALIVVIFICGLIPLVGHTIGAVIVTTVAIFHSPASALIILAYYILYQQIENYIVQPRIQANSTNMSPLLVFASVIIGVNFGGLFGGLIAIPAAGCIRIAMIDYLKNRKILVEEAVEA